MAVEKRNVTDGKWSAIYTLFERRQKTMGKKYEPRKIIDEILSKPGEGTLWKKFSFTFTKMEDAHRFYRESNKDGRWSQIKSILRRSRHASE